MIKIIETYSDRILAHVKIKTNSCQSVTDVNGLIIPTYSTITLPEFKAKTSPYKSNRDREKAILKEKLNVLNSKDNGLLLIIRHDDKNLVMMKKFLSEAVDLNSVSVNGITFYKNDKKIEIDDELLNKMNLIYNMISKIDKPDFKLLTMTISTIIQSYTNTGIVSKKDLVWLNGIYNKYKRLGDLYE